MHQSGVVMNRARLLQDTLTVSLSQSKHHSITIFNWFNQSKPSTTADRSKPKTVLTPDKEAEIISEMYTFLDHNGIKREDCKLSQKYLDKHDYQRSPEAYPPAKTLKPGSAVAGPSGNLGSSNQPVAAKTQESEFELAAKQGNPHSFRNTYFPDDQYPHERNNTSASRPGSTINYALDPPGWGPGPAIVKIAGVAYTSRGEEVQISSWRLPCN
ncbi:hypothetical protein FPQ18DRAFT_303646 [Pyronema domesticum]|nr:hypothetical protein FPQ18DRAFT_303646 [Pyronema domesticum]